MKENAVSLSHVLLGMKQNLEPGEYAQTGWSPHAEANPLKRLARGYKKDCCRMAMLLPGR